MNAAVLAIVRSELRRRWLALVVLGVLAGLAGAGVSGAVAVARRTTTADTRLQAAARVGDAFVVAYSPDPAATRAIASLPQVERAWFARGFIGKPIDIDQEVYVGLGAGPLHGDQVLHPVVIEGRMSDPRSPSEVVLFERIAHEAGLGVGDRLRLKLLAPEEFYAFDTGFGEPDGPVVEVEIVGLARVSALPDAVPSMLISPVFAQRHARWSPFSGVAVDLRGGQAATASFERAVEALSPRFPPPRGGEEFPAFTQNFPARSVSEAARSTKRVLSIGLALFGGVVGVVGLVALAQAFARHHAAGAVEQRVEAALGLSRGARTTARTAPALVAALVAAAITFAGTLLAGVFEPMGGLRLYEPNPGWAPNLAVAAAGALVVASCVLGLAALTASRVVQRPAPFAAARPRAAAERLARAGASPEVVTGVRFALEPGRGQRSVPVRSAIVGAIVGIVGVVAATTFAANVDRLLDDSRRYGWDGDFMVIDLKPDSRAQLLADPRIEAVGTIRNTTTVVEGRQASTYSMVAERGSIGWTVLSGRLPRAPGEILLGPRLADRLDRGPGDAVTVRDGRGRSHDFAVVGVGLGATTSGEEHGTSVLLGVDDQRKVGISETFVEALVRVHGELGESRAEAIGREYSRRYEVTASEAPLEVMNLRDLGSLPEALAAFVGIVGVVALANGLLVAGRRRAHELAVLRTIGFTPRQTGWTLVAMAGTVAVVAVVLGAPVGVAAGSTVWRAVAEAAYVPSDVDIPPLVLALVAPAALALAVVVAAVPARHARRLAPATLLHTE